MNIDYPSVYFRYVSRFSIPFGMLGVIFSLVSEVLLIHYVAILTPVFMVGLYVVRKYALLWFFAFIYIVYVFPYFLLFLGMGDFSSWRQGQISYMENVDVLTHMARMISMGVLLIGILTLRFRRGKYSVRARGLTAASSMWSRRVRWTMYLLGLFPLVVFSLLVAGKDRGVLLVETSTFVVAVLNIAFMLVYLGAGYFITSKMVGKKWMFGFFLSILASLLFAYAGFRYCLVGVVLIACTAHMQVSVVKLRRIFGFIVLGLIAYFLLTLIALSRNLGVGTLEVVKEIAFGGLDFSLLISNAGAHEQNIYYSFLEVFMHGQIYYGELYVDAVIRVLPSFVYGGLFETVRPADVIAAIAAPEVLLEANMNLGAFFLAESYLNFGKVGIYFVFLLSIIIFDFWEWRQDKSFSWKIMYYVMVALLPSYIYYGSNSMLKVLVYSAFIIFLLRVVAGFKMVSR